MFRLVHVGNILGVADGNCRLPAAIFDTKKQAKFCHFNSHSTLINGGDRVTEVTGVTEKYFEGILFCNGFMVTFGNRW